MPLFILYLILKVKQYVHHVNTHNMDQGGFSSTYLFPLLSFIRYKDGTSGIWIGWFSHLFFLGVLKQQTPG